MSKIVLSFPQRLEIHKRFEAMIEEGLFTAVDGNCHYAPGWSDARVADQMDFPCNIGHIGTLRKEVYGKLYNTSDKASTRERIQSLEDRVAELERVVTSPAN